MTSLDILREDVLDGRAHITMSLATNIFSGMGASTAPATPLAPKVRAFLDYFSEYFGSPPYWDVQQD